MYRQFQIINYKLQFAICCLTLGIYLLFGARTALALVDPLASPNNKFGIHLISPTQDESSPAAQLVNSSGGDWGYVTILVESKDRDQNKWQNFFNDLRRKHLIPIVRLATQPDQGNWKLPYEDEEQAWADFLGNLNWPAKNRYIIIYNEPNHGQEWGGSVNAKTYAQILNKTIDALKAKNEDFFVLNAGFDASAPQQLPKYQDELSFLKEMEAEVPGIFNKLDGWVSHSYPNPGFIGSPDETGRGTVRTWEWELQVLRSFGVTKNLPVFITETGWKHAEGINYDSSLPTAETVGKYFQEAFQNAWNSAQIVAVTPFLLDYQEQPFDHFSFKKLNGSQKPYPLDYKILGASYPEYYPHYEVIARLPKDTGRPYQENKAKLIRGSIYATAVANVEYSVPLTFENTGQSIWNEYEEVEIKSISEDNGLNIGPVKIAPGQKIEPGEKVTINIPFKASHWGTYQTSLQLFMGNKPFDQEPLEFITEVKAPVSLILQTKLPWKQSSAGEYLFSIASEVVNTSLPVKLNGNGNAEAFEVKYLLPDYTFKFTLHKPFYKPKTIEKKVISGINILDFGTLEPDFFSALFKPREFWKLLPFSN